MKSLSFKKASMDSKETKEAVRENVTAAEIREELLSSSENAVRDSMGELLTYMDNEVVASSTIDALQNEIRQERERTYILERRMTEEKLELEATRRLVQSQDMAANLADNAATLVTEERAANAAASERADHTAATKQLLLQAFLLVALIAGLWFWMSARAQSPVAPTEEQVAVPVRRVCLKLPGFSKVPAWCLPLPKK